MMMILHGDDTTAIHRELSSLVSAAAARGDTVVQVNAREVDTRSLESILGTMELFAPVRLLVIDRPHALPRGSQRDALLTALASAVNGQDSVVIIEHKLLTPTQLKKFPTARVITCKIPQQLFGWLDQLGATDVRTMIRTHHEILRTQESGLIFSMLVRQIRMLWQYVADGTYTGPPFGRKALTRLASHWSPERTLRAHQLLLAIDTRQKTSRSALSLAAEIDLFLAAI